MRLVDRQTYFNAAPIIVSTRWAKVTLTCNEPSDPIRYLPLRGEGPAQTLVHHDDGVNRRWTSQEPSWESAPVVDARSPIVRHF